MTVYVIEEGEYSDRKVIAVRETLKEAKEIVERMMNIRRGWYEEKYDITAFDTKNSVVFNPESYEVQFKNDEIVKIVVDRNNLSFVDSVDIYRDGWCDMRINAKSIEQAKKIAYDKLAELKAEQAGIR